jgi:Rod binding domain-containing protein
MDLDLISPFQEKMSLDQLSRLRNLERKVGSWAALGKDGREVKVEPKHASALREASEDFESLLIDQMLSAMRKTLSKERLYGGGLAEDIFQGMLDEEYSKLMARSESFGLAEKIYDQLSKYL